MRMTFDDPMSTSDINEFRTVWFSRVIRLVFRRSFELETPEFSSSGNDTVATTSVNMSVLAVVCTALLFHLALGAELTKFEDWEDLEISSKVAAAMPYQDYKLDIYELQRNRSRGNNRITYVYTPVVQLNHTSASYRYNPVTEEHEVVFQISFWTKDIQNAVVNYLRNELQLTSVKDTDVTPIRFNRIILTTTSPSRMYSLTRRWENYRLEPSVEFKLLCFSVHNCKRLTMLMKNKPDLFSNLQMGFTVTSKTSRSTTAVISAESILTGKFFSRLNQRFPSSDFCLLTAEDTNQLISDSVSNIAVRIFDDTGVVNPNSAIYNQVQDILIKSTVSSSQMDQALWKSVFWNDDNARPDKTSKIINEVYQKSESECQEIIRNILVGGEEKYQAAGVSVDSKSPLADFHFNYEQGFRKTGLINNQAEKDEFLKTLRRSRSHVEWDGETFQPKNLLLSRVNMGAVRNQATFTEVKSSVTYATVGLTMSVKTFRQPPPDRTMEYIQELADKLKVKLGSPGPAGTPGANGQPGQPGIPGVPGRVIPSPELLKTENTLAGLQLRLTNIVNQLGTLNATLLTLDKSRDATIKEKINCAMSNVVCRDLFTRQGFEDGAITWLKEHNVACRRNEYLSRFEFIQARPSEMRYDYRCCRPMACQKCVD